MRFVVMELPAQVFFSSQKYAEEHAQRVAQTHSMGLLYVLEVKAVVGPKIGTVPEPLASTVTWLDRLWRWGRD